jgi:outer membrane protein OmpA-like peptidoglycan-associated protein
LLAALALLSAGAAVADATIPSTDLAGARDLPWLQRYEGSLIVAYTQVAYDEYTVVLGPLQRTPDPDDRDERNNRRHVFQASETLEGARTRIIYLVPAGRSPLEVVRNYQQTLEADGAAQRFACKGVECGGDARRASGGGGGEQSLAMKLWPASRVTEPELGNAYCAQTIRIADQRFATFALADDAGVVQVHAWIGEDSSACRAFGGRTFVVVDVLERKAREQRMVTVDAGAMKRAIDGGGRVALYGITFDLDSAAIRPDSEPTLSEIAALLGGDPALRLRIVGHTDDQGALDYNLRLSQSRADAVRSALVQRHDIAADRLSAHGVAFLAPLASNVDEDGRAKNRRVELLPW